MKLRSLLPSVLLSFFAVGLPVTAVFAQARGFLQGGLLQKVGGRATGLPTGGSSQLLTIVGGIINVALSVLGMVLLGYLLYAGYVWMTAQGDEANVKKAKDIIKNAIIGLVIITLAFSITNFVLTRLNQAFSAGSTPVVPSTGGVRT